MLFRSIFHEVLSIEKGWYRIMTEFEDTYLFPPEAFEVIEGSEEDLRKENKIF